MSQFIIRLVIICNYGGIKNLILRGKIMNCFYCGKKKRGGNTMFYKLDQDGHEICQSCMNSGYWKDALEIIEHNKQVDKVKENEDR